MSNTLFELIEQVKTKVGDYTIFAFDNSFKKRFEEMGIPIKNIETLKNKELLKEIKNNFPLTKDLIYILPKENNKPIKIVYEKRGNNEL